MGSQAIAEPLDTLSDAQLVLRAQAGERDAFATLYDRYFDRVYDFLTRMMRNRAEAEDVTQDTFIRAMGSIGNLQSGASFKSWLFTIARNTALNRIERSGRSRPMPVVGDEESGETLDLHLVDTDRFGNPEDAAQATAVASLVWEAASGLNEKQYSLLDLHLRQGLDSGDIADVLNVTRNNAYVMLNRMKAALAETVTAYIMMNEGRYSCPDLDGALNQASIARFSPAARRVVSRHVASCAFCQQQQSQLVSPLAILGALIPAPAAPGVKDAIREGVLSQWPTTSTGTSGSSTGDMGISTQLLASVAALVTGAVLLAALVTSGLLGWRGADEALGQTSAGLSLTFIAENGEPLPGVGVHLFDSGGTTPIFEAVTDGDGVLEWPNAIAGEYDLVLHELPDGITLSDADRVLPVQINDGQHLVLTAQLRTTGS